MLTNHFKSLQIIWKLTNNSFICLQIILQIILKVCLKADVFWFQFYLNVGTWHLYFRLWRLLFAWPDGKNLEILIFYILQDVRTKSLAKFCRLWRYTRHLLSNKACFQGFHFRNFTRWTFKILLWHEIGLAARFTVSPCFVCL